MTSVERVASGLLLLVQLRVSIRLSSLQRQVGLSCANNPPVLPPNSLHRCILGELLTRRGVVKTRREWYDRYYFVLPPPYHVFTVLQLSNAETINCTVTLDAGQTLYSVPRFNETYCHYRWTNSTDHVLANHHEKNELVTINTNWRFQIKGCLEEIHYRRDCISEGLRETICTTSCGGIAGIQSREEIKRHHWFVLAATLFLLPVVLFLCYKSMNHTRS